MSKIKLIENRWIDENGNSWKATDYSYEVVRYLSETLVNCFNCFNCENCKDCTNLSECTNCIDCHYSKYLFNRFGCEKMVEYVVQSDHGTSIFISCVVNEEDCCLESDNSNVDDLLQKIEKLSYQALVNELLTK